MSPFSSADATAHDAPDPATGLLVRRWRTLWISTLQLGSPACRASCLLDFLHYNETQTLYLLGTLIEARPKTWHWPKTHNDVLQWVLRLARHGTRVYLIPGPRDHAVRPFLGQTFGDIEIHDEFEHLTADQRRLLVIRGNAADLAHTGGCWSALGELLSHYGERLRAQWRHPDCQHAAQRGGPLGHALAEEAHRRGLHGIVGPHTHPSPLLNVGGLLYCHHGNWSHQRSALAEDHQGCLHPLNWPLSASPARTGVLTPHPVTLPTLPSAVRHRSQTGQQNSGKTR